MVVNTIPFDSPVPVMVGLFCERVLPDAGEIMVGIIVGAIVSTSSVFIGELFEVPPRFEK